MKKFILLAFLTMIPVAAVAAPNTSYYRLTEGQQSTIDKMCSQQVGVPYGTDNLTDGEWWEFDQCRSDYADWLTTP